MPKRSGRGTAAAGAAPPIDTFNHDPSLVHSLSPLLSHSPVALFEEGAAGSTTPAATTGRAPLRKNIYNTAVFPRRSIERSLGEHTSIEHRCVVCLCVCSFCVFLCAFACLCMVVCVCVSLVVCSCVCLCKFVCFFVFFLHRFS